MNKQVITASAAVCLTSVSTEDLKTQFIKPFEKYYPCINVVTGVENNHTPRYPEVQKSMI
jgi:hypothetical protein